MDGPYWNTTGLVNATGMVELNIYVNNNVLGGWLGALILLLCFAVAFVSLKSRNENNLECFAGASLFNATVALVLLPTGLLSQFWWWFSLTIALGALGLLWYNKTG